MPQVKLTGSAGMKETSPSPAEAEISITVLQRSSGGQSPGVSAVLPGRNENSHEGISSAKMPMAGPSRAHGPRLC